MCMLLLTREYLLLRDLCLLSTRCEESFAACGNYSLVLVFWVSAIRT